MIKSRPKLLLIRGLGHSGTTILDLALGANPDVMGLGEAARLLRPPEITDAHDGPYRLRNDMRLRGFVLAVLLLLNVRYGVNIWSGFVSMTICRWTKKF